MIRPWFTLTGKMGLKHTVAGQSMWLFSECLWETNLKKTKNHLKMVGLFILVRVAIIKSSNTTGLYIQQNKPEAKGKILYDSIYIITRIVKFIETKGRMVVSGFGGKGIWSYCLMSIEFQFRNMARVLVMVAQLCECT